MSRVREKVVLVIWFLLNPNAFREFERPARPRECPSCGRMSDEQHEPDCQRLLHNVGGQR
jgi:hypothetical protein